MKNNLKIGIVARVDLGGLGHQAYSFWKHIPQISRELIVLSGIGDDLYRYPKGTICQYGDPTLEDIDEFLQDIDIVIAFETAYNWNIFSKAKEKGIKIILIPNYEWTTPRLPVEPDLYLCLSKLDYDLMPEPKVFIQMTVDRKEFPFQLRKKAETFVFNNGAGGSLNRNGLSELLQAIPLVKSKVRFLIRSQVKFKPPQDPRVEVRIGAFTHESLYKEGDMFIFPHKFDGLSLPIQEALSAGMPVISTDIYPHNTYLPKEWLFKPAGNIKGQVFRTRRMIDIAILDPQKIAEKIDEFAGKDITEESKKADKIAESISWDNLQNKFIEIFRKLC